MEDLKPGLYMLTHDVTNPRPDKRSRHDWRDEATWAAGMILRVRWDFVLGPRGDAKCLVVCAGPHYKIHEIAVTPWERDKIGVARMAALRPAMVRHEPTTVAEALAAADLSGWESEAVDRLVREGRLTFADVVAAARAESNEPEAQPTEGAK